MADPLAAKLINEFIHAKGSSGTVRRERIKHIIKAKVVTINGRIGCENNGGTRKRHGF